MKKKHFPMVALVLGILLSLLATIGSVPMPNGNTRLPVLMLLLACEMGFIVTVIGGAMGFNQVRTAPDGRGMIAITAGCLLLAIAFAYLGLELWSTLK